MTNSISQHLIQLGLSADQAAVYQTLLTMGSVPARDIIHTTRLPRATVYKALDALIQQQLVSTNTSHPVKTFSPENPSQLVLQHQQTFQLAEAILPELRSMYLSSRVHPETHVYEGLDEIKRMYNSFLTLGYKHYKVIGSEEFWHRADSDWFADFAERRHKAGISVDIILEDSKIARQAKEQKPFGRNIKLLPDTKLNMLVQSDVAIFPDRVIFQNYGKEFVCIEVLSLETANTMNVLFDLAWRGVK